MGKEIIGKRRIAIRDFMDPERTSMQTNLVGKMRKRKKHEV